MSKVAKESGVQRETLYRPLSERGNPTLDTLTGVLSALDLKISIVSAKSVG
jgi:probable addiction module antidote protein